MKNARLKKRVFIIAEAGVNHNGRLDIAKRLVDVAKKAGCDAVKFQTFRAEGIVSRFAPKADYQKIATDKNESQWTMLKRLELSLESHQALIQYCRKQRIMFLSTPFDIASIYVLRDLGLEIFKIPSGEIDHLPYLRVMGALRKKVILSTGMAHLADIQYALNVLVKSGTARKNITVLHCTTAYPAAYADIHLTAMATIREKLKVAVGYSDHSLGIEVPIAAVALGATVIEKHFTLNKSMAGPDHKASLDPVELSSMVKAIRHIEGALGDGIKAPTSTALKHKLVIQKSVVAACDIRKGDKFTWNNLAIKRPGTGISPKRWDALLGKRAKFDFTEDELIRL